MKMSTKDALHILGLTTKNTIDDIKLAYRKSCSVYHPDRNPAGLEMMKLVNAAYKALDNYIPTNIDEDAENANYGDALNAALNSIINLGLHIEVCGSWIWVSGDTRPHKEILKSSNFKWAPKKAMWHFRPAEWKSLSRGKYTMDQIREKHGSQVIKTKSFAQIAA